MSKLSRQDLDDIDLDDDFYDPRFDQDMGLVERDSYDERAVRRAKRYSVRRHIEDYAENKRMRRMLGDLD